MKKLLILAVLFISTLTELKAQPVSGENSDNETVYWFYIKPEIVIDKEIKKEVLDIKKTYGKIYKGDFDEFLTNYKKELFKTKLAVGPFPREFEAKQGKSYYSLVGKNSVGSEKINASVDDATTCCFYLCDPIVDGNKKELKFERMPASIASGSIKGFVEALSDVRLQNLLVVGPFLDYFDAERSKFVNRKQDDAVENKFPSINSVPLDEMLEKWKSIDVKIVKDSIQPVANMLSYSFNMDFKARYFDSKTLQAIVVKLEYDDLSQIKVVEKSFL